MLRHPYGAAAADHWHQRRFVCNLGSLDRLRPLEDGLTAEAGSRKGYYGVVTLEGTTNAAL